ASIRIFDDYVTDVIDIKSVISRAPIERVGSSGMFHIRSAAVDHLLYRGAGEDAVALIGGEGEALSDDGVVPRSTGDLTRCPQIADREGRAQTVGAGDPEATHVRV